MFNPGNWYWFVGTDISRVYSSSRNIYVALTDAAYVAWCAAGNRAPVIDSEASIWYYVQSLLPAWLFNGTTFAQPGAGQYTKAQLAAYAAKVRFDKEIGGVSVGALAVRTDRESQAMISGAYNMASRDNTFATQWKGADGTFTQVDAAAIISLSTAIGQHVANCFAKEADVVAQINAGTLISLPQIDQAFAAVA